MEGPKSPETKLIFQVQSDCLIFSPYCLRLWATGRLLATDTLVFVISGP